MVEHRDVCVIFQSGAFMSSEFFFGREVVVVQGFAKIKEGRKKK